MSKISLSKDTVLYTIMFFGQKATYLILAPLMIHFFTAAEYGYFTLVNMFSSFLLILGIMGVADQGLPRFLLETHDEEEKKGYVNATFFITLVANVLIVFLLTAVIPFISKVLKIVGSPWIFYGMVVVMSLSQTVFYLGNLLLRWTFQSSQVLRINLSKSVLSTLLAATGIIFLTWQAKETLLATAFITLLSGFWANYCIRNYLHWGKFSIQQVKRLLRFSYPLLGFNLVAFCSLTMNGFLLAHLTNLHDVGIFSVAVLIANIFETITSGFFWASGPYILSTYKETWAPKKYAEYFNLISILGIVCIIILGIWGGPIIKLFKPDGTYQNIGILIPWVLGGTIFYHLGAYFSPGPYLQHKTYINFFVFLFASIFNFTLSYLLIPLMGIVGAGIAVTLSNLFAAVCLQIISHRLFFIPNSWRKIFSIIFLIIVLVSQANAFIYSRGSFPVAGYLGATMILLLLGLLPLSKEIHEADLQRKLNIYMQALLSK